MTDLEKLIALEEVRGVKARYCRFLDTKQWDAWAEVFAADAVMDVSHDVTEDMKVAPKIVGRDVIVNQVRTLVGAAKLTHQVHTPEIEFTSPSQATGIWAMEDYVAFPDGVAGPFKAMHGFGHYHETYERQADGWVIKSLKLTRTQQIFS